MKFTEYIASQFGNPRNCIGKGCCFIMNKLNKSMYDSMIKRINAKQYHQILDIGFGNGYLIYELSKDTTYQIYGIDISKDMLGVASKQNKKAIAEKRVQLALGNCCELQFKEETFDAVLSVNTIYFWPDTLKGLKEIHRVLKLDGVFYNMVYSREWLQKLPYTETGFKVFEPKDYIRLGKEAGFTGVIVEEVEEERSYCVQFIK